MKLLIFIDNYYQIYQLPFIVDGNFWVTIEEHDGNVKNILNVYSFQNSWVYEENANKVKLEYFHSYIVTNGSSKYSLFVLPLYDESLSLYSVSSLNKFLIGSQNCDVNHPLFLDLQLSFLKKNSSWLFQSSQDKIPLYVNRVLTTGKLLENGDHIFYKGFEIFVLHDFFVMNNPFGKLSISNSQILLSPISKINESKDELDLVSIYKKED